MLPRPSTAVPSETTATVLPLMVSAQADSGSSWMALLTPGDAGRVGHREVVAGLDRHLRRDLDLAALVHEERAVGHAHDLHALERADGVDHALGVGGVDAGGGHVARDAAAVDAHEVDRAEDRALRADRAGHLGERAGQLAQLDAHRERVGGGRLEPRGRLQAGHRALILPPMIFSHPPGANMLRMAAYGREMRRFVIALAVAVALAALGAGKLVGASRTDAATVERVVDGDTIVVRTGGRTERVRYIGMDTPESVKPGTPVQCYARPPRRRTSELVQGERVKLVLGRRGARPLRPPAGLCLPRARRAVRQRRARATGLRPRADDPAERRARRRSSGSRPRRRGAPGGGYGATASFSRVCACARASPRSRTPSSRRSRRIATAASGCAAARSSGRPSGIASARTAHGSMRFFLLVLVLLGTAAVVTVAMFQTLYYLLGLIPRRTPGRRARG